MGHGSRGRSRENAPETGDLGPVTAYFVASIPPASDETTVSLASVNFALM